jgi:hypothetical protein
MKKVRIYLRSLLIPEDSVKNEKRSKDIVTNKLLLFDSNRNGAVNDLITVVPSGALIIWKRDRCSGIRKIIRIESKTDEGKKYWEKLRRLFLCEGFIMRAPIVKETLELPYSIEYLPYGKGKEPIKIDPLIKVPPPPPG